MTQAYRLVVKNVSIDWHSATIFWANAAEEPHLTAQYHSFQPLWPQAAETCRRFRSTQRQGNISPKSRAINAITLSVTPMVLMAAIMSYDKANGCVLAGLVISTFHYRYNASFLSLKRYTGDRNGLVGR
ncbi:MAG: hypothetical protein ABJ370_02010 [Paracoccaceae bacterium]